MILQPGVHLAGKLTGNDVLKAPVRRFGKDAPFVRAELAFPLRQEQYQQGEHSDKAEENGKQHDLLGFCKRGIGFFSLDCHYLTAALSISSSAAAAAVLSFETMMTT